MTDAMPNSAPKEPGRWRAIALAAVVHVALFAFLWFGVRWQNETPVAIEAEVWSPQAREAAPRPEPEQKPEPQPVVKPTPEPVVVPSPIAKPDIALEQEKKRKIEKQKAREDKAVIEKKKAEENRLDKEKNEAAAKKKLAAEEAKKEAAEKQRKLDAADEKIRAKTHDEEMRRIAGAATGSGGSGDASKSQGSRADAGYGDRIGAKIKSNTVFNVPDNIAADAAAGYLLELFPDGSVRQLTFKKPSGVSGFDDAVRRAVAKSAPFPPDKSGAVPSSINVVHKVKDQ